VVNGLFRVDKTRRHLVPGSGGEDNYGCGLYLTNDLVIMRKRIEHFLRGQCTQGPPAGRVHGKPQLTGDDLIDSASYVACEKLTWQDPSKLYSEQTWLEGSSGGCGVKTRVQLLDRGEGQAPPGDRAPAGSCLARRCAASATASDGGDTVEGLSVESRIAEGLRLIDLGHPAVWLSRFHRHCLRSSPIAPIDSIPKIKAHKGKKVARVTYGTANGQANGDSGTC